MTNAKVVHLVGTQCRPDAEDKFNQWYNEVHIPMLLKFKGLKGVTRYKRIGQAGEYPEYLTVYQFDSKADFDTYEKSSPEVAAAREDTRRTWQVSGSHPAKGEGAFEVKWRIQYKIIKSWKQA